jgi:hypothetical protein
LIGKGYATEKQLEIVEVKREAVPNNSYATLVEVLFQLKYKRSFIPGYSIIPFYVMQYLALSCEVPLTDNQMVQKYPFEYDIPKGLEKYAKEQIEIATTIFENQKPKQQKFKLEKSNYIHLSSNYNLSKVIEKSGERISISQTLDRLFYVNNPNYENNQEVSYIREFYTHDKSRFLV